MRDLIAAELRCALDPVAFARERLADYKVPRRYTMIDALPKNALGKVLKRELRGVAAETSA